MNTWADTWPVLLVLLIVGAVALFKWWAYMPVCGMRRRPPTRLERELAQAKRNVAEHEKRLLAALEEARAKDAETAPAYTYEQVAETLRPEIRAAIENRIAGRGELGGLRRSDTPQG